MANVYVSILGAGDYKECAYFRGDFELRKLDLCRRRRSLIYAAHGRRKIAFLY